MLACSVPAIVVAAALDVNRQYRFRVKFFAALRLCGFAFIADFQLLIIAVQLQTQNRQDAESQTGTCAATLYYGLRIFYRRTKYSR